MLFPLKKTPYEIWDLEVDFSAELDSAVSLVSGAVTAVIADSSTDASATIVETPVANVVGKLCKFRVKGGVFGVDYVVSAKVIASDGQRREANIFIRIAS